MKLLGSQWDDVYLELSDAGLPPEDFDRSTDRDGAQFDDILTHRPTGFYFRFRTHRRGDHFAEFSPGASILVETAHPMSWDQQRDQVRVWLSYVRREVDTPNLWQRLAVEQEGSRMLASPAESPEANAPFSSDELADVRESLREIRDLIAGSVQLTDPQTADLDARVRYLESAAERTPRIDWWNILVGQVVQFFAQWAISGDVLRGVLHAAGTAFGRFFGVPTSSDLPRLGSGD